MIKREEINSGFDSTTNQPDDEHAESHDAEAHDTHHTFRNMDDIGGHALHQTRKAAIKQAFQNQDEADGGEKVAHRQKPNLIGLQSKDVPTVTARVQVLVRAQVPHH